MWRGDTTISQRDETTRGGHGAQQEDKERRCDNKLVQRVDERVAQREDGESQCNNQLTQHDNMRAAQ